MTRLSKLISAAALAAAMGTAATAQEVTLIMHHFLPPVSSAHKAMLEPWAEKIETESEGRIAVEIAPSMAMGGKPNELYGQVRDGAADIVWTLLGYTPGVFPRSEVFELPLVHAGSAVDTTIALNASMEMLAEDFEDVKVLFMHSHEGNLIHSAGDPIRSFDDAKGLKLRTPSRTGAWLITAMGAEPVGMPVPTLPEAMAKGVVDGALTPFEIVPALSLQELDKSTTELPEGDRFGTSGVHAGDEQGHLRGSARGSAGDHRRQFRHERRRRDRRALGGLRGAGVAALEGAGVERIVLSEEEGAKFDAVSETVVQQWIDEVTAKGIDGAALVEGARAAVAEAAASR